MKTRTVKFIPDPPSRTNSKYKQHCLEALKQLKADADTIVCFEPDGESETGPGIRVALLSFFQRQYIPVVIKSRGDSIYIQLREDSKVIMRKNGDFTP